MTIHDGLVRTNTGFPQEHNFTLDKIDPDPPGLTSGESVGMTNRSEILAAGRAAAQEVLGATQIALDELTTPPDWRKVTEITRILQAAIDKEEGRHGGEAAVYGETS